MSTLLRGGGDRPALIAAESGESFSHARLAELARRPGSATGRLVFLFADNSVPAVIAYLAAVENGNAVALLDAGLPDPMALRLVEAYRPDVVVHPAEREPALPAGYRRLDAETWENRAIGRPVHADLAVLLTTSGSTGSPKFVRLSRRNIEANAESIVASLGITSADRAVTSLPLHYGYGMSVLTSHLVAGASVLVGDIDLMDPGLFARLDRHRVTSFAGVPFTYQTLRRVGFDPARLPHMRTLTQAGGRLDPAIAATFAAGMATHGGKFFVMYGQTEASPRIAAYPVNDHPGKRGSAGRAIPGVELTVRDGVVRCRGENVMMGYAESRADLSKGDEHGDTLDTGDLGHLDSDGFLFLTGRTGRVAKVAGLRVSLDEIEAMLSPHGPVAVVTDHAERLRIFHAGAPGDLHRRLCRDLKLPMLAVVVTRLAELPALPNGKTDYRALGQLT